MLKTAGFKWRRGGCRRCGGFAAWDIDQGVRAARCVICGAWEAAQQRPNRKKKETWGAVLAACAVEGCSGRVLVEVNTSGICSRCGRMLADWERSKKTKPPPLIKIEGKWHFNPLVRRVDGTPHRLKTTEGRDNVGARF